MLPKGGDAFGRQREAAFGGFGLWREEYQAALGGALQGSADVAGACVEVEVGPTQAEQFSAAQPVLCQNPHTALGLLVHDHDPSRA
jgi:hypothetical protein